MKKFLIFFLVFISFSFCSNVSAETLENIGYINNDTSVIIDDNYGNTITLPRQTINSQNITIRTIIITANYQFSANTDYILELNTPNAKLNTNINVISLRGYGSICNFKSLTDMSIGYPKVRFSCPSDTSYIVLSLSNLSYEGITSSYNFAWNYSYLRRVLPDNTSQDIIDNQNQNTQDIIDNQNQNTQDIIDSNKVCNNYNLQKNSSTKSEDIKGYLTTSGSITSQNDMYTTSKYYFLNKSNTYTLYRNYDNNLRHCLYDKNKSLISCYTSNNQQTISITPDNDSYIRFTYLTTSGSNTTFTGNYCLNSAQATTDAIDDLNNTINDSDIDNSDANDFFNNFTDNTHGLSGIISSPLTAINAMLNNQCTPLTATWKNTTVSLPCGYDMWNRFTSFKQFLNVVLDGLLCYQILVKLFKLIERFKNPNDDRVEVMDL